MEDKHIWNTREHLSPKDVSEIQFEIIQLMKLLNYDVPPMSDLTVDDFISVLKESSLLLQGVLNNVSTVIAKYDFCSDHFEPIGAVAREFFSSVSGKLTMRQLRDSKLVAEENIEEMGLFLDKMCNGIPKGEINIKIKRENKSWQWYHCTYVIAFDQNRVPLYAIIFCKDITEIRDKVLAAQRFRDFMQVGKQKLEVGTRKVVLNIEYNLTKDSFESSDGVVPDCYREALTASYTEAIQRFGQDILPSYRESFLNSFSRTVLWDAFSHGVSHDVLEFPLYFNGKQTWVRILYQLLRDPYNACVNIWLSCRDVTQEHESALKLVERAQFDPVTEIYNRAALMDKIQEKCAITMDGICRALIMLDVDGFGQINDVLGHAYGDKVLKDIAKTLKLVIEPEDMVARIGGDEFAIYVNDSSDLESVKERLRIIIAAIYRELKHGIKVSMSAGIALFPKHGDNFQTLYEKADIALYHAKLNGRNRYVIYHEQMQNIAASSMVTPIEKPSQSDTGLYIRTFGYFDLFHNGEAILIPNPKAKELLALLVDRRGGFVSPGEIIACLWEGEEANQTTFARCRKVFMLLRNTLKEYHLEELVESKKGLRRLNTGLVSCDLYNYLSGKAEYAHLFKGVYMMNYSWGEFTFPELNSLRGE